MTNLTGMIKELVLQNNSKYIALRERVMKRAANANNGVPPKTGMDGRMHAPFDGYYWDEKEYHGGSYLPLTPEMWEELEMAKGSSLNHGDYSGYTKSAKIKSTIEMFNDVENLIGMLAQEGVRVPVEISHGKTWGNGDCYIYIKTKVKSILDAMEVYAEEARSEYLAEARKSKGESPDGRLEVTGVVINLKYYIEGSKMTVKLENGSTVYGSLPSSIADCKKGDEIKFTATFERANGDSTHSFYKRPSKASITKI